MDIKTLRQLAERSRRGPSWIWSEDYPKTSREQLVEALSPDVVLKLLDVVEAAKLVASGRPNNGPHAWMDLDEALTRLTEVEADE